MMLFSTWTTRTAGSWSYHHRFFTTGDDGAGTFAWLYSEADGWKRLPDMTRRRNKRPICGYVESRGFTEVRAPFGNCFCTPESLPTFGQVTFHFFLLLFLVPDHRS